MRTNKRITGPLTVMFGVIMSVVAFAGPANAADPVYPPPKGTQVLGVSQTAVVPAASPAAAVKVAGVTASTGNSTLAFTGTNAIGVGALGGLLLVGGGLMLVAGKRRKING